MNTYTVRPESFESFKRKTFLIYGIVIAIVIAGLIFIFPFRDKAGIVAIAFASFFVLIIATFAMNRALKRLREVWTTYTLTIDDDFILKTQTHYPDIKISRAEIRKIQKSFGGDIVVKGGNWRRFIIIPSSLNGIGDVECLLTQWQPIKKTSVKTLILSLSLSITLFLGSIILIRYYFSLMPSVQSIKVTIFVAMILSFILLWMFRSMPQIDERAKPKRWLFIAMIVYLIILAISIIISVFFKPS